MDQQAIAEQIGRTGSAIQYTGASWALILGFVNANAAALGVIIGLVGLLINYHFKRKALKILENKTAGDILRSMDES